MNDLTLVERIEKLEQQLDDVEESIATDVIEVSIAKLEPTADDVVFIWLPDKVTDREIAKVGKILAEIIQDRFRFIVARKNLEIEMVKGKHSPILLPS